MGYSICRMCPRWFLLIFIGRNICVYNIYIYIYIYIYIHTRKGPYSYYEGPSITSASQQPAKSLELEMLAQGPTHYKVAPEEVSKADAMKEPASSLKSHRGLVISTESGHSVQFVPYCFRVSPLSPVP